MGEVTSEAEVDFATIVRNVVGLEYEVQTTIVQQSKEIARGVDTGGAGDQGIMLGYATSETANFMPQEYELARGLCQKIYASFPFDGKVQVTMEQNRPTVVVASFQNASKEALTQLVSSSIEAEKYLINPAGDWGTGGFDADTGLTGRKLVVDSYGPRVAPGGGAFSGKDYTKVDRSGAYMARRIAVDLLLQKGAKEVLVKLAYAIGVKDPVMA
jgi:S-adenosylmethionine synthetase